MSHVVLRRVALGLLSSAIVCSNFLVPDARAQSLLAGFTGTRAPTAEEVTRVGLAGVEIARAASSEDPARPWRDAEARVKEHRSTFERALDLSVTDPTFFRAAVTATPPDSDIQAASLARTSQDASLLAKAIAPFADKADKANEVLRIAAALAAAAKSRDALRSGRSIELFAEGNVRSAIEGSGTDASTANGAIGLRIRRDRFIWNVTVNVASTRDTLTSGFGGNVLLIGNGTRGINALIDLQYRVGGPWGLRGYAGSSKSTWTLNPSAPVADRTFADATVAGLGASVTYTAVQTHAAGNDVGLAFEAGPAMRKLTGDIVLADSATVTNLLNGETKRTFFGFSMGTQATFGVITAAAAGTVFPGKVPGFSKFQLTAGLSVAAPLVRTPSDG